MYGEGVVRCAGGSAAMVRGKISSHTGMVTVVSTRYHPHMAVHGEEHTCLVVVVLRTRLITVHRRIRSRL